MAFYYSYMGNKRKELQFFDKYINLDSFDSVIEPFGGSGYFSRHLFKQDPSKKYIISDNNQFLVNFCNNFYKNDDDIINKAIEKMNEIKTKEEYNKFIKNGSKLDLVFNLIFNTWYNIRPGLYADKKPQYKALKKNKEQLNLFFQTNEYLLKDYVQQLEIYKDDERALIFLDPPYILSCNALYESPSIDWGYLYDFTRCCKCKFIIIVNENIFMKLLFKEFLKESNNKIYEGSKKKVIHNIYTNINII